MTGNQQGEKTVLLYCLIGSQEVKLAPGHTTNIQTSYDHVLRSSSGGMRAVKAMAGRNGKQTFFANHINSKGAFSLQYLLGPQFCLWDLDDTSENLYISLTLGSK